MSTPTLSTKLPRAERDRFVQVAESQGKSTSALLQFLVRNYLQSGGKVAVEQSTPPKRAFAKKGLPPEKTRSVSHKPGRDPSPDTSPGKQRPGVGLPTEYLPPSRHPVYSRPNLSTSAGYTYQPGSVDVIDLRRHPFPSPKSNGDWVSILQKIEDTVYRLRSQRIVSQGKPETSAIHSSDSGLGWLFALGLLWLGLRSRS